MIRSGKVIQNAYDETTDVFNLLDEAESELFAVAEGNIRKDYQNMTDLILQAKDEIEVAIPGLRDGRHTGTRVRDLPLLRVLRDVLRAAAVGREIVGEVPHPS